MGVNKRRNWCLFLGFYNQKNILIQNPYFYLFEKDHFLKKSINLWQSIFLQNQLIFHI
jgi:hypothetical protein